MGLTIASDFAEDSALLIPVAFAVALVYLVVGLAWLIRRQSLPIGALMIAIGFAITVHSLYLTEWPVVAAMGRLAVYVAPVLIGHLLMIYPSGRFEARYQRGLVALGYFNAFVLAVPALLLYGPSIHCSSCTVNPLQAVANDGLSQSVSIARLTISATLTTGLTIALTERWNNASRNQRKILGPMICTAGATLAVFAVLLVTELVEPDAPITATLRLATYAFALTIPLAAAYGQIATRFARALTSKIYAGEGSPEAIQFALQSALKDDTLRLAYWLPTQQRFADADGRAVPESEYREGRQWSSIDANGQPLAAIVYDADKGDQSELLAVAGEAVMTPLEHARLAAELRARVEELRGSRTRLVEAADRERRRIERDLHDGAQQHLISIALNLTFAADLIHSRPNEAEMLLAESAGALAEVSAELRDLARGIHSAMLADRGLVAAVQTLADRSALPVKIDQLPDVDIPPKLESAAYFVVSESLANAARSAQARVATVRLDVRNGSLHIEVSDDGVGGADPSRGTGLTGLNDRVSALDGELEILSPAGVGTTVRATLPFAQVSHTWNPTPPVA
ncbi:MAG: histidine kinase [Solirubrobacterales bacterium]